MIQRGEDFVTETVFSHPSKLDLLREARDAGYETWVMHIGVEDADISVARVAHRVTSGGHNVPEDKIRERFDRSLILVREAVHLADVGLVYDNSIAGQLPKLVLTFKRGLLEHVRNNPPAWIRQAYSADLVRL